MRTVLAILAPVPSTVLQLYYPLYCMHGLYCQWSRYSNLGIIRKREYKKVEVGPSQTANRVVQESPEESDFLNAAISKLSVGSEHAQPCCGIVAADS